MTKLAYKIHILHWVV